MPMKVLKIWKQTIMILEKVMLRKKEGLLRELLGKDYSLF